MCPELTKLRASSPSTFLTLFLCCNTSSSHGQEPKRRSFKARWVNVPKSSENSCFLSPTLPTTSLPFIKHTFLTLQNTWHFMSVSWVRFPWHQFPKPDQQEGALPWTCTAHGLAPPPPFCGGAGASRSLILPLCSSFRSVSCSRKVFGRDTN